MDILGTCEKKTAAQWRLSRKRVLPTEKIGIWHGAVVLCSLISKKCTVTDLNLSLLYILMLGTYGKFALKIISWRSAFAFCRHAWALAACLPRHDHVYITTDESFRFHNNKFDEMPWKLNSTENPRSFKKYPTPQSWKRKRQLVLECKVSAASRRKIMIINWLNRSTQSQFRESTNDLSLSQNGHTIILVPLPQPLNQAQIDGVYTLSDLCKNEDCFYHCS